MADADLKQKLTADLKQAMRDGDKLKRGTLRMLLSAINNAEIARRDVLPEADVLGLIAKDVRLHKESIEAFQQGNRPDLVAQEEAEMSILQAYLPRQMSREEIVAAVRLVIAEVGAQGPSDKGKVMPRVIAQLKGRADGRDINEVVTELLAS
ncbi:MAG: GatB/YqeY domain-containing protein [Dehalococcoidales bacterium]